MKPQGSCQNLCGMGIELDEYPMDLSAWGIARDIVGHLRKRSSDGSDETRYGW